MGRNFKGNVGSIYLRDIPKSLRDFFHGATSRRGKTMKDVLVEFMEGYVARDQKILGTRKKYER